MASGHDGKPMDYDELERWTRIGYERGMSSARASDNRRVRLIRLLAGDDRGPETSSPGLCSCAVRGARYPGRNVTITRATVAATRASVTAASAHVACVSRWEANLSAFIRCSSSQTSRTLSAPQFAPV